MKELLVNLNEIAKVKEFVHIANSFNKDEVTLTLVSGRYIIDAGSILGIFSLNINKNIKLVIETTNEQLKNAVCEKFQKFTVA